MFKGPEALATEFVLSSCIGAPRVFSSGGRDAGRLGAGIQVLAPKPKTAAVADLGLLDCRMSSSKSVVTLLMSFPSIAPLPAASFSVALGKGLRQHASTGRLTKARSVAGSYIEVCGAGDD